MILNSATRETGQQISVTTEEIRQQAEVETTAGSVPTNARDKSWLYLAGALLAYSAGLSLAYLIPAKLCCIDNREHLHPQGNSVIL